MPANINSAACHVMQCAKAAPSGTGIAADAANTDSSGGDAFGAIFQQLSGKQLAAAIKPGQIAALAKDPSTDAPAVQDALAALLPFLDAMGLTAVVNEKAEDSTEAELLTEAAIEADEGMALAGIASNLPKQTADEPAISAVAEDSRGKAAAVALAQGHNVEDTGEPGVAVGAKHRPEQGMNEFSAELVEAIQTSKEQPRTPGSTAAAVQQVLANHAPQSTHATSQSLPVAPAVGAPGWSEEVGNRVIWMANRMESRAELVLTPPQMGRVEVSLSISGDQASATFVSPNPAVREALEAALPRLREVLADAGIQLGQAQVGAENARQWAQQEKNSDNPGFDRGTAAGVPANLAAPGAVQAHADLKMGRGLVDVFA
jgi:flagellar hook-length control protein FliK